MGKNSLKFATFLFALLLMVGAWFGVLYNEEHRRLAQAATAESAYLEEIRATDRERKAYFESVAATRAKQAEAMEAARIQYEELLKSQNAQIKSQAQATTQTVSKPVTKTETVKVAKPAATRKSKSS